MDAKHQPAPSRAIGKRVSSETATSRVEATMRTAALAGLTTGKKERRLSWRANERLVRAAEERSGLAGSDLLEYALATVALEDDFADTLLALRGAVDRAVDLEF